MMIDTVQMELGFNREGMRRSRRGGRTRVRPERARWWFAEMRRLVGVAVNRAPVPPARPRQECLAFARMH